MILVVGTVVAAWGSWWPSYWNDEAATLQLTRLAPDALLRFLGEKDAVHGLYALVMHAWVGLVGEGEFVVRLPSAVAVGVTCAALFGILRLAGAPRAAVPAAVAFLLLPRTDAMGIDARSFAMATAAVTLTVLVLLVAQRRTQKRWWALFAGLLAVSIALFLYVALLVPALALWVLLEPDRRRGTIVAAASAIGVALVATSPLVVVAASQRGQVAWLRDQPVNAWTVGVESFFGEAWWLAAAVTVLVVAVLAVLRPVRRGSPWLLFLLWVGVPLVALLLLHVVVGPLFTPRYLSTTTPAVAGLVGLSVAALPRRWRTWTAVALVVLALPSYFLARTETAKPGGQPLRAVATYVQTHASPGDAIVFGTSGTVSLRPRIALAAYPDRFRGLDDVARAAPWPTTGTYSDRLHDDAETAAAELRHDRVWVVLGADGEQPGAGAATLRAAGYRSTAERFGGMTVVEWVRG